jgi:hypothetical protein
MGVVFKTNYVNFFSNSAISSPLFPPPKGEYVFSLKYEVCGFPLWRGTKGEEIFVCLWSTSIEVFPPLEGDEAGGKSLQALNYKAAIPFII